MFALVSNSLPDISLYSLFAETDISPHADNKGKLAAFPIKPILRYAEFFRCLFDLQKLVALSTICAFGGVQKLGGKCALN